MKVRKITRTTAVLENFKRGKRDGFDFRYCTKKKKALHNYLPNPPPRQDDVVCLISIHRSTHRYNPWPYRIASTHLGLVDAGPLDCLGKHAGVTSRHGLHAALLPLEELAVLDEPVLDHLRDPGRLFRFSFYFYFYFLGGGIKDARYVHA